MESKTEIRASENTELRWAELYGLVTQSVRGGVPAEWVTGGKPDIYRPL